MIKKVLFIIVLLIIACNLFGYSNSSLMIARDNAHGNGNHIIYLIVSIVTGVPLLIGIFLLVKTSIQDRR